MSTSRASRRVFETFQRTFFPRSVNSTRFQNAFQRRRQTTVAGGTNAIAGGAIPSGVAGSVAHGEASGFTKFFNSPVGPKTVHFWAPIMKWGLVLAGISDFARPAESLSLTQNGALVATGAIWTRWCFVIKPRNVFLAAVNFFLFCVGTTQVTRIFLYHQSLKDKPIDQQLKQVADQEKESAKGVIKDAEKAIKG